MRRLRHLFASLLEFLRLTDEDGLISGTNVGYFGALALFLAQPGQWTLAGVTLMVAHYAGKKLIKQRAAAQVPPAPPAVDLTPVHAELAALRADVKFLQGAHNMANALRGGR